MNAWRLVWQVVCLLACLGYSFAPEASDALAIGVEAAQPLGAYADLLDDPSASLDLAAIRRADAEGKFQPLPPPASGLGFRPGATWVRFTLANPAPFRQERWLQVDWIFQQSYVLYWVDAQGHVERMESGTRVAIAQRPLASRLMLFPVNLAAGESKTFYLRIAGRAATVVDLTLWQPAALLDHLSLAKTLKYLLVGGVAGVVMVFGFQVFQVRRRPKLLAFMPSQLLAVLAAWWMDGYALDWLPADETFWLSRGLYVIVFLAFFFHAVFAKEFLDLHQRHPRLDRLARGLAASCLFLAALPLVEGFPGFNHYAVLAVTGLLAWIYFVGALREDRLGFTYLVVCGGFCLTVFAHVAQNLGWLPGLHSKSLWLVGLTVSGLAMAYALYRDTESVRLKSQEAQARLLAREQGEAERLARAVEESTGELRMAMHKAEAANQAKSTFLSMMSHEFRTPLHIILGYADLLKTHAEGDALEKLALIEKSGMQLLHLVEKILKFNRGEQFMEIDSGPVNLKSLAAYMKDVGQMLAEKNQNRFRVELPPDLPEAVEADERRLTRVLFNLIGNACKFTERGNICLRFMRQEEQAGQRFGGRHWIRFEVEDNGIGIAEADQERIFEPFSCGPNGPKQQSGIGLGLAICRQIVRAMGGEIGVHSGPGHGSLFHFTLCLAEALEPCRTLPGLTSIDQRLTLLVVDEMAANRPFLVDLCRVLGFAVVMAANGEEAAACCFDAALPVDAVLIDQSVPGFDSWRLLKALKLNARPGRRLPVVLVSATLPKRPEGFPDPMEFDGILVKPFSLKQLAATLQSALDLEWLRETPNTGPVINGRRAALPPAKLVEFKSMLVLGQVLALRRWAESLATSHPDCAELARQIKTLSQAVDLPGLQTLLAQVSAQTD